MVVGEERLHGVPLCKTTRIIPTTCSPLGTKSLWLVNPYVMAAIMESFVILFNERGCHEAQTTGQGASVTDPSDGV
jgi:hypothetical protein